MRGGHSILPERVTPEEAREACRALKGAMLRQEVYALDGTEAARRPYSVTERSHARRLLQRRHGNNPAVFFTHPRERLTRRRRTTHAAHRASRARPGRCPPPLPGNASGHGAGDRPGVCFTHRRVSPARSGAWADG
ncbi:hypothetical protein LBW62_17995 [Ralstonia solanacearum]|uniref:toxin TcdB middle/C-terminal domain-containing protein n=2 Tax=Ralstonia solanacearum TaxID=305 RepID=UPI0009B965DE|nr:hypothetical protein [Ralstonia solanacearum]MBB6593542.1 hypothetical protein [Ralstonia solanacearum]MBB6595269.1 hypothetical protein [Ralstonia solanacearum]MBB6597768.1 hypothetical protein [Ralstonia solanacearum]MDB0543101.1 hypothetical protein [Ralstonia solanacearum]